MTPEQKRLRELLDRQSQQRQRMAELAAVDELSDEQRSELDGIEKGTPDLERQIRAARIAVEDADSAETVETREAPEADRERLELRSRCSVRRFFANAARQRSDGAEAELQAELGLEPNQIPMEMWTEAEARSDNGDDIETRAITPAPGTVGVNLDVFRPAVFAPSIVDKLMVEMPMVESGTYATGTIATSATAGSAAKSHEVPETAAAFTVGTTMPHRIGASLNLSVEDIAAVGQDNFESVLRQHISLVLSDELDDQLLNGVGDTSDNANDVHGLFYRLTDPSAPEAGVAGFDTFVGAFADQIEGLWATEMSQVSIVAGVDTYKLSAKTFRDIASADLGSISFADYAKAHTAGWWTNKRMPATASKVQQAIVCRKGRSMMPSPMRLAVCPHWGYISVDDIYTGARKGERRYVVSVLVGDVLLVQPDAYAQVAFRVSA